MGGPMSALASEGDVSRHGVKTAAMSQEETLAGWRLYFRLVPKAFTQGSVGSCIKPCGEP